MSADVATSGAADAEWSKPSTRLVLVRRVQLVAVAVPVLIVIGVLTLARSAVTDGFVAVAILAVLLALMELFFRRRIRAWGYAERHDDLLVRRGVLVRRLSVVPYGRMQYVDVTAGPFERAFGLATVRMHTAAAASDARIPGLVAAEAARLRDRLAELGHASAAGL